VRELGEKQFVRQQGAIATLALAICRCLAWETQPGQATPLRFSLANL